MTGLSSSPRPHLVEGENPLPQVVLLLPQMHAHARTHSQYILGQSFLYNFSLVEGYLLLPKTDSQNDKSKLLVLEIATHCRNIYFLATKAL